MSANNWAQCPRCYVANRAKAEEKEKLAFESYGKVPPDVFDRLRDEARNFRKDISEDDVFCATLREDWGLGFTEDSEFYVNYSAACTTCGFKFEYRHEEEVK
jgi:hypothetical protein